MIRKFVGLKRKELGNTVNLPSLYSETVRQQNNLNIKAENLVQKLKQKSYNKILK
jgi:hypothetical protein